MFSGVKISKRVHPQKAPADCDHDTAHTRCGLRPPQLLVPTIFNFYTGTQSCLLIALIPQFFTVNKQNGSLSACVLWSKTGMIDRCFLLFEFVLISVRLDALNMTYASRFFTDIFACIDHGIWTSTAHVYLRDLVFVPLIVPGWTAFLVGTIVSMVTDVKHREGDTQFPFG
ncbi:hypothetical protein BX666DRAFT_249025 [Dichotomocladium elegans]|nr:hypothetical protein BX666DRAFT_249025 [Dichotomocladium elegans]